GGAVIDRQNAADNLCFSAPSQPTLAAALRRGQRWLRRQGQRRSPVLAVNHAHDRDKLGRGGVRY
ncbi:MAG TPA: hypothetical protein VG125_07620, partial [Pirellulales bacterium]|nr:hypothetical protein [Pirellulales bacterium]